MSKFLVWIDNPTASSVFDYASFNSDSQRMNGFAAGSPASAARVNTMLRQSSLLTLALWNALGLESTTTVDIMSTVGDVKSVIEETNLFKLSQVLTSSLTSSQGIVNPTGDNFTDLGSYNNRFKIVFTRNLTSDSAQITNIQATTIGAQTIGTSGQTNFYGTLNGPVRGTADQAISASTASQAQNAAYADEAGFATVLRPEETDFGYDPVIDSVDISSSGVYLLMLERRNQPSVNYTYTDMIAIDVNVQCYSVRDEYIYKPGQQKLVRKENGLYNIRKVVKLSELSDELEV